MTTPLIYWFRQDLRLHDLPGLAAAVASKRPLVLLYILDDESPGEWRIGAASRWWLHHSLASLHGEIGKRGGSLLLRRGETVDTLLSIARELGAQHVYCSRMYEPWAVELEQRAHATLQGSSIELKRYPGSLLFEPEAILNGSGQPYKVFTPFWRACLAQPAPAATKKLSTKLRFWPGDVHSDNLRKWALCPSNPDWAAAWPQYWRPGTAGARSRMKQFFAAAINNYSDGRDHPAQDATTRLSPHMHYGELSPRDLWHQAQSVAASSPKIEDEVNKLLSELGWREFSAHLMFHYPAIANQAFKEKFRQFPWLSNKRNLRAWQRGETGYPMVDAGMRELWQTGYMHNRVRMIVASFLTKHLLLHWCEGAKWFWDTLLDANLANNTGGWQWVAGSGADASPYFRIFNPITQGVKFDAKGDYVRHWVPELKLLPTRYLHAPWEAPAEILKQAGVELGTTYPHPIVDHREARESALAAYGSLAGD